MSVVEEVAGGWARDLLGLPAGVSHGFTTGCQMAHVTGLAVARHVEPGAQGLGGGASVGCNARRRCAWWCPRTAISRSTWPCDGSEWGAQPATACLRRPGARHPTSSSASSHASRRRRRIVTAQAGNVTTGSFEDFGAICRLAHRHEAWVHVDGALGRWVRASERRRELIAGVDQADSWATDGDKTLNVPHDWGSCSSGITERTRRRSPSTRTTSSASTASATTATGGRTSRAGRATPVYVALGDARTSWYRALVDGMRDRAAQFAEILGTDPRAEVLNEVVFNQVLVRFADSDEATTA